MIDVEAMPRDAAPVSLHLPSRHNASQAGIVPVDSRRFPSVSQVPPAVSRRILSFDQAHMLQPSLSPYEGVHIHLVRWASMEATRQEVQA